ncbi:MAG: PCI domain-containing protein [Candidatus Woesearchaeota archaeon]
MAKKNYNEDENGAQVRAIIEILGKPKEHVVKTLNNYINKIKEDKDFDVEEEHYEEPVEQEDQKGVFSTFSEITFNINDINKLISFCFDYMPSSVEIIEPENFNLSSKHLTDLLNDMQSRLHHTEMLTKKLFEENKAFNSSLNVLTRNLVMLSLGNRSLDISTMSKLIGISEDKLKPFLDKMVEEKRIKFEDNLYSILLKNE